MRSIGLIESIRKALVGHLVISSSLDAKVVFLNSAICLQEVHIIPFASEVKISYFGTKRDQSLCTNEPSVWILVVHFELIACVQDGKSYPGTCTQWMEYSSVAKQNCHHVEILGRYG